MEERMGQASVWTQVVVLHDVFLDNNSQVPEEQQRRVSFDLQAESPREV